MNVQAYIESGILESYVNGLLTEEESKAVDEIAAQYPEVSAEIQEIQLALNAYSKVVEGNPQPPSLDQIMNQVQLEEAKSGSPATKTKGIEAPQARPIIRPNWMKLALVAAVTLLVGLSFITAFLYNQMGDLRQQLDSFKGEMSSLKNTNDYIQQQYSAARRNPIVIEPHNHIVSDPASLQINMKGLEAAPTSEIKLYWHTKSHAVYLVIEDLPEPPTGHQYQLWAIIDGVSVDAGIFDHHTKMQQLRTIEGAVSAFTVTLEEKGGSPTPRLDQLYVKGEVKS